MRSSNAEARLVDGTAQDHDTINNFPSDADTVRIIEFDLLDGDQPEFRYWVVYWSECDSVKPPRRFWNYWPAKVFAERLKCRLNCDAYNRDCEIFAINPVRDR